MGKATDCGKRIFFVTLLVFKSTHTNLGPPYSVGLNNGLPVSRIHNLSTGSTTTDCTDTNADAKSFSLALFNNSLGYAIVLPSSR